MPTVFCAPSRYVQGPGVTASLASEMQIVGLDGPVLLIASARIERMLQPVWDRSFAAKDMAFQVHRFGGECSSAQIEQLRLEVTL